MKINNWLDQTTKQLSEAEIGSAQLDALILLEDELQKNRAYLLAHPEIMLTTAQIKNLKSRVKRRQNHEPMAYIRGFTEFYGHKIITTKDVLEPRPESETMIDMLLELKLPTHPIIADIGTGSGAIAIAVKLKLPAAKLLATEIDEDALKVARLNSKNLDADVEYFTGDLLDPIEDTMDVILANLPYVPDKWQINEAAAMEPRIAIFGGADGLDLYRQLFEQISTLEHKPQFVLTESLPPQHQKLSELAAAHQYKLHKTNDFIQVFCRTS